MTSLHTVTDHRRFRRVRLALPVRFLIGDTQHAAELCDISLGGAAISTRVRPRIGDRVIAYIDRLERFEGRVVRLFRRGFAIEFSLLQPRRRRVCAALTRMINDPLPTGATERRREWRVKPLKNACDCELENGEIVACRITNISVVGASLSCDHRPRIGSKVIFRRTEGRVVRHTHDGFAIEFPNYWRNISPWRSWRTP